jgi:membrane protein required for colicin V production
MNETHLNILDWSLVIVMVFCYFRGILRGAVSQVFGVAGIMGGMYVATHYQQRVAPLIHEAFPRFADHGIASFLLLLFLTWFCIGIAGYWISGFMRQAGLRPMDRFFGAAIGLVKGGAIAIAVVTVLMSVLPANNPVLRDSRLAPYAVKMAKIVKSVSPDGMENSLREKGEQLKKHIPY